MLKSSIITSFVLLSKGILPTIVGSCCCAVLDGEFRLSEYEKVAKLRVELLFSMRKKNDRLKPLYWDLVNFVLGCGSLFVLFRVRISILPQYFVPVCFWWNSQGEADRFSQAPSVMWINDGMRSHTKTSTKVWTQVVRTSVSHFVPCSVHTLSAPLVWHKIDLV